MNRSLWQDGAPAIAADGPLAGDVTADACVIGAGVAGMTAAALLAREGLTVVVLERGAVAGGATGRTTAHLSNVLDDHFTRLESLFGEAATRLAAASHAAAIDRIESLCADDGIACGFERIDGYLLADESTTREEFLAECAATRRAGLPVEVLEHAPPGSPETGLCARYPGQAQLEPLRYLSGLAGRFRERGGRIHTGSAALDVARGTVRTAGGRVRAGTVVVATNAPIAERLAVHARQAPYTSYVVAARVPPGTVPRALFWDTASPYHFVRLADRPDGEVVLFGGEDHRTAGADDGTARFQCLELWARERWPALGPVTHRWSGQIMQPVDGLGLIGESPAHGPGVYIVTGDSGNGITHATIAGMIITDRACGRPNPWSALYDPARLTVRAAGRWARENVGSALRYARRLLPGEVVSERDILPGEGALLRRGTSLVAAWRDAAGRLHERSATCPHEGCVVRWNRTETTWDCGCHGSRFQGDGAAVAGPARRDLDPSEVPTGEAGAAEP